MSRFHNIALRRFALLPLLLAFATLSIGWLLAQIPLRSDHEVDISIKLKSERADFFQIFYLTPGQEVFTQEQSVGEMVQKSDGFKNIHLRLPLSVKVAHVRFDLGSKPVHEKIKIDRIRLTYNNRHINLFDASGDAHHFALNRFVNYKGNGVFELKNADGFDPFIVSRNISAEYDEMLAQHKQIPVPYLIAFILSLTVAYYRFSNSTPRPFIAGFYTVASTTFIVLLLLPMLNEIGGWYKDESSEQRTMTQKPTIESVGVIDFPAEYEKYYNDHFGFRNLLVSWGGEFKYKAFKSSFSPEKVSVGKDGWLFLNGEFYEITQDLTASNSYSKRELAEMVSTWEKRKAELERDSIAYFRAFWPDKHLIYPELLPFCMNVIKTDTPHRYDQALDYLREHSSPVQLLDIRPVLFRAKDSIQIYQKYDSHWNNCGAFIGYTALMNMMAARFPQLKPHPATDFYVDWADAPAGDLANTLGIKRTEKLPFFYLKTSKVNSTVGDKTGLPARTEVFINEGAATDMVLLVFRDSFTTHLMQFINLHFKKVIYMWDVPYSPEIVKQVNPDIVLEGFASRYFK